MKNKFNIIYKDLGEVEKKSFARFNYRERMKLERTLFLILQDNLPFQVKGFSTDNKAFILDKLRRLDANKYKVNLIEKIFELRFMLRALSSGNPYEKYDALFADYDDRISVFGRIRGRIKKIEELIKYCD